MKRESLRRTAFVSLTCLLCLPWLTPCVGIWSSAGVNAAHDSITKRAEPLNRLPDPRLKEWAAKPGPRLKVVENRTISPDLLVSDAELSFKNGGRNAPRPGTLVGKGASAVVDGVAHTLNWVDPFTLATGNSIGLEPTKPRRRLILCEAPFVMLEGEHLRHVRDPKTGEIRLAKAENAQLTIITPEGSSAARAQRIHYRGPGSAVVLEGGVRVRSGEQKLVPAKTDALMKLNFVECSVACSSAVKDDRRISAALKSGGE